MPASTITRPGFLFISVLTAWTLHAQALFPVRDAGEARNRSYDVLHYRLEVSFDEAQRKVMGRVSTTLIPFPSALTQISFDAEEMDIRSVSLASGTLLAYRVAPTTVDITLDRPYSYRDTLTIVTEYACTPRRGLFFVQPDSAYPDTPRQIWTQGEDMDNHFWFPCYDFPNDRATSEVFATVRSPYAVLSNGKLMGIADDRAHGTRTFHWKLSRPHVAYLVMLAIGEYAVLKDSAGKIPLEYYVYPHHRADARVCFRETPAILKFFSDRIGYPFPWEKYAQVLIRDFTVGGMENTSACSLSDVITVYDARQRIDDSPTSLIAHELAHQWWGDLVTCKDWRHLWLNEGFASYFDPLYHEQSLGRDAFDWLMYEAQQASINGDKTLGRKPIVSVGSYGTNLYPRGASVLHMLRHLLGDSLFFRSLNHYIVKHQFGVVETNDLKVAIEEATGQNLYWFFDQWLYGAGYPQFAVSYTWNDSSRCIDLHVEQTQQLDSLTGIFRTPVDVELCTGTGTTLHRVMIESRDTVIALPAAGKPRWVIFDKGNWILKEVRFTKSDDEWLAQMREAQNPIDRLAAVKQCGLASHRGEFIPPVIDRVLHDDFWSVRHEAITMLGLMADNEDSTWPAVKAALIAATHDTHPRVRRAAVALLKDSADAVTVETLYGALKDSSYAVVAQALRSLAKADPAGSVPIFEAHLNISSHQDIIASAALDALVTADTLAGIAAARRYLPYGMPVPLRHTAVRVLGRFLGTEAVPESTFYPLATDGNINLRANVVRMLGRVGTTGALSLLDAIAADPANPASEAAKRSAERIRRRSEQTVDP